MSNRYYNFVRIHQTLRCSPANGETRKQRPIDRKQITELFADLKGSMELLSERDYEEAVQRVAESEGRLL